MIEKTYLKTKPQCKVKFTLPSEAIGEATKISVVGDFNNWDASATPLSKKKTGEYSSTLKLDIDQTYQFRYVIDDGSWLNDEMADSYVQSPISQDTNSVLYL